MGMVEAEAGPPPAVETLTRGLVSLSPATPCLSPHALLATLPRRGQPEVEGGHPEEHGDGPGGGDAQQDAAPGQPRVHRGQHEQLRL